MQAIQVLSTDAYGSMLWDLGSAQAEQYFKCWNTCVKLVYAVPRSTFTYLVEGHFAAGQTSLRNQVLSRYSGFFRNLLQSPSREVRVLARIVSSDPRSTTCVNLRYLQRLTGLDQPQMYSSARVRIALPVKEVPELEKWRLGLMTNLFKMKSERFLRVEDSKSLCAMIDSLCRSLAELISILLHQVTPATTLSGGLFLEIRICSGGRKVFILISSYHMEHYVRINLVKNNPTILYKQSCLA